MKDKLDIDIGTIISVLGHKFYGIVIEKYTVKFEGTTHFFSIYWFDSANVNKGYRPDDLSNMRKIA